MKTIRIYTKLMLAGIVLSAFSQCSSQKLVKTPPFVLGEVMAEEWVEAGENGASGTHLFIPVEEGKAIPLDSVYFRGKAEKLEKIQRDSYLVYIGRFKNKTDGQEDMILHADPEKEFGNKPPELGKKIPFELEDDEAVVSFMEKGKTKYYKIEDIKASVPVQLPEKQPEKGQ